MFHGARIFMQKNLHNPWITPHILHKNAAACIHFLYSYHIKKPMLDHGGGGKLSYKTGKKKTSAAAKKGIDFRLLLV